MITQNPIVGRSRKKLAGVYARTLWGKNVIQSCPTPSNTPPTQALKDSRAAFARVSQMANMVPSTLLANLFYTAPLGKSRRAALSSQLFTGVQRSRKQVAFNLEAISQLGSNVVVTTQGLLYTIPSKSFTMAMDDFSTTSIADTSRVPCVFAISYDLRICVPLTAYTSIEGNTLVFDNISDTLVGNEILIIPLWQTNIGSSANPIWVYGSFSLST